MPTSSLNIVLLHAHDAGRYCQPYGHAIESPHLMQFAREGVLFRKAFAVAPTCGPSRAAMLTGQYAHQCEMYGLPGGDGWTLKDINQHLVATLNRAGYLTALAGVQHEVRHSDLSPLPYQRFLDTRQQKGEFYPETLDRVEEFLTEPRDKPFFLSIGIDEPHRNNLGRPEIGVDNRSALFSKTRFYDPAKLDSRYTAPLPWLPDLPEFRQDMESFREGARMMDEYMGRVFTMLRQRGLDENTLVIVTTDHGIEFTGGKKTLTDQGTGVMLLMRGPGGFSGGRIFENLVSHLDIYPTILEAIGHEKFPWLEGRSLGALVRGETTTHHEEVFTEQNYHGLLEALRAVRTERYKLLLRHDPKGYRMKQDGPTDPLMAKFGYYDRSQKHVELYDMYLDPLELHDRSEDPAYASIRADLQKRIDAWMQRTNDCFPSGKFPPIPRTLGK